jgi:hypothetical protein
VLWIFYISFSFVNLFMNGIMEFNGYNALLASFMMVFLCIAYYYQLLTAREIVTLKYDTTFWITTGMLIYHLGSGMNLFLITIFKIVASGIHTIVLLAAIAMYLNYSIGYLCHKKTLSGKQ